MLVLSRKAEQCVVLGRPDEVEHMVKVTVLEISGRSVRLGFEADTGLYIHRWEVWERIHAGTPSDHPTTGPPAPSL